MTPAFWRGRQVLLTGHTGVKGAWLALWLERLGARLTGLALAPDTTPSLFDQAGPWPHLVDRRVDLRDARAVDRAVAEAEPEIILHLAAQSLVRRGYAEPTATFATNVMGTAHLLEAARHADGLKAVLVVTSDKVYRNDGSGRPMVESDRLGGHDPYAGSKAAAELAVETWRASFLARRGVGVATARAGNVVCGGDQAADRLVPDVLRALSAGTTVVLRHPDATRPWQHALDPLAGYLMLAERLATHPGTAPAALNFGPGAASVVPVRAVVERLIALWGSGTWRHEPDNRLVEAGALAVDAGAASRALGWRPRLDLDAALGWTVEWAKRVAAGEPARRVTLAQIDAYMARG